MDKRNKQLDKAKTLILLGYVAVFLDALGGGGWGPIATATLVANNIQPNEAIGSVNFGVLCCNC